MIFFGALTFEYADLWSSPGVATLRQVIGKK